MKEKKNSQLPIMILLGVVIALFAVMTIIIVIIGNPRTTKKNVSSATDTEGESIYEEYSTESGVSINLDDFSVESKKSAHGQETPEAAMDDPNGYLLPDSGTRYITEDDLTDMTAQELTYARNEIYARYGKVFESSELNDYFNSKDWYDPEDAFEDKDLSELEAENANFILNYQKDNDLTYKPQ